MNKLFLDTNILIDVLSKSAKWCVFCENWVSGGDVCEEVNVKPTA